MSGAYAVYIRRCGLAAAALTGLLAAVNVAVDPYLAFSSFSLAGLAPYRGGSKVHKAELLRRQKYDTLLLGTSRTEVGIDPSSAAWGSATVFDASLPGTNLWQTQRVLAFAMSHAPPRRVVLFADFLMFNGRRASDGQFARSRFEADLTAPQYVSGNLVGVETLKSSWRVLARRASDTPAPPRREVTARVVWAASSRRSRPTTGRGSGTRSVDFAAAGSCTVGWIIQTIAWRCFAPW